MKMDVGGKEEIEEIFSYYSRQKDKSSQEMVVALLQELQEVQGCLTPELKRRVQEITGVSASFLQCLIRMYPSLKETRCSHEIIACTGERCAKKEGLVILEQLRKELKPDKNGISVDGVFEVRTRNCLKQCRTSPNLLIDGNLYYGNDLKDIRKLLQSICRMEGKNKGYKDD